MQSAVSRFNRAAELLLQDYPVEPSNFSFGVDVGVVSRFSPDMDQAGFTK